MELETNESFAKHYNDTWAKEEASKKRKTLKKQIKQIEQESSSSESESESDHDDEYIKKFVQQCDYLLRGFENKETVTLSNKNLFRDLEAVTRSSETIEKSIYAKDFNTNILMQGNETVDKNEKELDEIDNSGKSNSYLLIKQVKSVFDDDDNDDLDDLIKNTNKPTKYVVNFDVQVENSDAGSDLNIDDNDGEEEIIKSESTAIEINRDRKLETVRVSKTATRSEKRKEKKERKEKELKEKMKNLKEIQQKSLHEKIERIKKIVPQAAEELIMNELDEDFDVDEISKKLTIFFQEQDASLPVDKEKPVFSDFSDEEPAEMDSDQEIDIDNEEIDEELKQRKPKESKLKKKKTKEEKKKNPFFTNLQITDQKTQKKKIGIVQKTDEIFDPEKHKSLAKFLKKNFDFFCEDLITGKGEGDDLPCKFKFRAVEQQDYGLELDEILFSDRRELNKWASLKKITQIRTKADEEKDRSYYEKIKTKKYEVLKSFYGKESEEENSEVDEQEKSKETTALTKAAKKRARKNAKKRTLGELLLSETETKENQKSNESIEPKEKKRKSETSSIKKKNEIEPDKIDYGNSSEIDIGSKADSKIKSIKKSKKKNKEKKIDSSEIDIGSDELKADKGKPDTNEVDKDVENKSVKKSKKKNKENKVNEMANENSAKNIGNNSEKCHKKKNKSKKVKKQSSGPILSHSRLESLGVNEGYYRYEVMGNRK